RFSLCRNGLRELRLSSLKVIPRLPRSLSVPGLVRIWMPPKPGRSFSAESGLSLMRISRIESREGMRPPSKPSMVICPPLGLTAGEVEGAVAVGDRGPGLTRSVRRRDGRADDDSAELVRDLPAEAGRLLGKCRPRTQGEGEQETEPAPDRLKRCFHDRYL